MISLQMVEILYFLQGFRNCQFLGLVIGAPLRQFMLELECNVFVNKYSNSTAYAACAFAAVLVDFNHIISSLVVFLFFDCFCRVGPFSVVFWRIMQSVVRVPSGNVVTFCWFLSSICIEVIPVRTQRDS